MVEPYQERLFKERDELKKKLNKLDAFLRSDEYLLVGMREATLLLNQRMHMLRYLNMLVARIDLTEE